MNGRRSFLRGLATLPLIGGSIAILGQPTRVAFDTSAQLRERYLWWLRLEHTKLCHEIVDGWAPEYGPGVKVGHIPAFALPDAPDMVAIIGAGTASSRAAVMLSAAGVPWTNAGMPIGMSIAQSEPRGRGRRVPDPFGAPSQVEDFAEAWRASA